MGKTARRLALSRDRRRIACAALAALLAAVPTLPAHAQPAPAASVPTLGLFIVTYRPGPAWQRGRPMRDQGLGPHARFIRSLLDDGRLFAGGPFVGSEGGMMILRAASPADAQAIVAADPAVTARIFTAAIEHWWPRFRAEGALPAPQGPPPG